jgi:formiminotetrahydrofolate cyclodeaminase
VRELLARLAADQPTPGGGAAAALVGALGAALIEMTANLTIGRPKYAHAHDQALAMQQQADALRGRLEVLTSADADAYARVSAAYRLPRDTDADRSARSAEIQAALEEAARVPLDTAAACVEVVQLAEHAAPVLNASVISDVLVGALLAAAALESAALNVEINVASMTETATAAELAAELERVRAGARGHLETTLAVGRARFPHR